jgi:hypothetical protein
MPITGFPECQTGQPPPLPSYFSRSGRTGAGIVYLDVAFVIYITMKSVQSGFCNADPWALNPQLQL